MSYNTATRLLLKFNGSNGATTTTDSSEGANAVTLSGEARVSSTQGKFSTNSLRLGNPDGTGAIGTVTVDSPESIFSTDTDAARRVDLWFYRAANSPWGKHPLLSITFQNGDTLAFWRSVTAYEVEINSANTDGGYTYQSVTNYDGDQTWVHLRFLIYGDTLYLGLNGAQILSVTQADNYPLWLGVDENPVTEMCIGGYPSAWGTDANVYVRGYLDAYEITEGDTSWTGGSYTVPSAEPEGYAGAGAVNGTGANVVVDTGTACSGTIIPGVYGTGANALADTESSGAGQIIPIIFGTGSTVLEAATGSGAGEARYDSVGANTVDAVACVATGVLGNDIYTTLMLHGNTAGLTADSSIYAQTPTANNVTQSYATPLVGDGAMQFSNPSGGTGGSQIQLDLSGALFANPAQDKIFDFVLAQDAAAYTGGDVFRLDFPVLALYSAGNSYIQFETNTEFLRARLYVRTPHKNSYIALPYPAANTHVRVAFLGESAYVCYNGVQVGTLSGEGGSAPYTLWPQTVACSSFKIGGDATSFKGKLDEFRIQEGTVVNHGYAGGDYTVDSTEWWPNRTFGSGANTLEDVASTALGEVIPIIFGSADTTLEATGNDGYGAVGTFSQGTGANFTDDVQSLALGALGELIAGSSISVVEDVPTLSSGSVDTRGYGLNTLDAFTFASVGAVAGAEGSNGGVNAVENVTVRAFGVVPVIGDGGTTTSISATASGNVAFAGTGSNSTLITSQGQGVIPVRGFGLSLVDTGSAGSGVAYFAGTGRADISTTVLAFGSIRVEGGGANVLEDVYTFHGLMPEERAYDSEFVSSRINALRVATKTSHLWVRTQ